MLVSLEVLMSDEDKKTKQAADNTKSGNKAKEFGYKWRVRTQLANIEGSGGRSVLKAAVEA